jgi:hypothetical protein
MNRWNIEEVNYLIDNYSNTSNEKIAEKLNKTLSSINGKAEKLKLKKSMYYIKNLNKERVDKKWKRVDKKWNEKEFNILLHNKNVSNIELSSLLNKSVGSITNAKNRLNIKIGKYTKDYAKNECLKYRTKQELRLLDPNLHAWVYKNNLIKEVSSHMLNISYSTPQLILKYLIENITKIKCDYNNRKVIKPYELDIFYESHNFGIEYDGAYFHKDKDNNKIKMCNNAGITLLTITEENMNKKNFKSYEDNIKNFLKRNIGLINKIFNLSMENIYIDNIVINKHNLFDNIDHLNKAKDICLKYNNYSDFIKLERNIYNILYNRDLLEDYTKHMKR